MSEMRRVRSYAGVGSRMTPPDVQNRMREIARDLRDSHLLRTGGARGADAAFFQGAGPYRAHVFDPSHATPAAIDSARHYHPAWDRCQPFVRRLHGRNMMILLGENLDDPVEFVVCWTPLGQAIGGTGHTIRAAQASGIRVYNLFHETAIDHLYRELSLDGTLPA